MNVHQLQTGKTLQQRLAELQGHLAELNAPCPALNQDGSTGCTRAISSK